MDYQNYNEKRAKKRKAENHDFKLRLNIVPDKDDILKNIDKKMKNNNLKVDELVDAFSALETKYFEKDLENMELKKQIRELNLKMDEMLTIIKRLEIKTSDPEALTVKNNHSFNYIS
jgi:hypothetical protein